MPAQITNTHSKAILSFGDSNTNFLKQWQKHCVNGVHLCKSNVGRPENTLRTSRIFLGKCLTVLLVIICKNLSMASQGHCGRGRGRQPGAGGVLRALGSLCCCTFLLPPAPGSCVSSGPSRTRPGRVRTVRAAHASLLTRESQLET